MAAMPKRLRRRNITFVSPAVWRAIWRWRNCLLAASISLAGAPYFDKMGFGASFRDKGRFSEFMDQFPVWLIENDEAALLGCASHMAEIMALAPA